MSVLKDRKRKIMADGYTPAEHERALNRLLRDIRNHPDPETKEPTNEHRRRRALWAVAQYARAAENEPDCLDTQVIDLLTDLLHVNDARLIDFHRDLDRARINHTQEAR